MTARRYRKRPVVNCKYYADSWLNLTTGRTEYDVRTRSGRIVCQTKSIRYVNKIVRALNSQEQP